MLAWEAEYQAHILTPKLTLDKDSLGAKSSRSRSLFANMIRTTRNHGTAERQAVLEELACRPDWWDDSEEVSDAMTTSQENQERYSRQADIVPPERLAACKATVIGVGSAIGRQVALQLTAIGIPCCRL